MVQSFIRKIKFIAFGSLAVIITLLLATCTSRRQLRGSWWTGWGTEAFGLKGELIDFTVMSDRITTITYLGGLGSNGWMMSGGQMACVSCHGPNGGGSVHRFGMQMMDAKDIRCSF